MFGMVGVNLSCAVEKNGFAVHTINLLW